jgi:hypothetical protein
VRKRNLAQAVQREVVAGYRVESQTDINAVLVKGKSVSHILHLILSLITFGLWLFVWPLVWYLNREQRLILNVDDYGNVLRMAA